MEALEELGIADYAHRSFAELSGGEQQLVLAARALAQQARLLLMDEPTSALDFGNQVRVLERVSALTLRGYTVLLSCHNPSMPCSMPSGWWPSTTAWWPPTAPDQALTRR
ncbi:MAG: ATP-binding cassette domain-containing protein [Flavonifractor plautii]